MPVLELVTVSVVPKLGGIDTVVPVKPELKPALELVVAVLLVDAVTLVCVVDVLELDEGVLMGEMEVARPVPVPVGKLILACVLVSRWSVVDSVSVLDCDDELIPLDDSVTVPDNVENERGSVILADETAQHVTISPV